MEPPGFRPCALIPCLNAADLVAPVLQGVSEQLPDVIVVDDGSTDDTTAVCAAAGALVVRHRVNRGKGAALLTGLAAAEARGFTHAISLDADGQHYPRDIPRLLEAARETPEALIIGARQYDVPNYPAGSKLGRVLSNFGVRVETRRRLRDTQSGFRVYPVRLMRKLGVRPSRFEWEVEVIVRSSWAGLPVREVPIDVYYPPRDERVTHYRAVVDTFRILGLHCRLMSRWMVRPLWPTRRLLPTRRPPRRTGPAPRPVNAREATDAPPSASLAAPERDETYGRRSVADGSSR